MYKRRNDWINAFDGLAAARKRAAFVRRSARKVAKDQKKYERRLLRWVSNEHERASRSLAKLGFMLVPSQIRGLYRLAEVDCGMEVKRS